MSGFLYFVEGPPKNSGELIADHGLGYTLSDCVLQPIPLGATPSGKPGVLLADQARHSLPVSYRADAQQWVKYQNHWVGMWDDARPVPADLFRADTVPGFNVQLGDDHEWQIPLVRQYEHNQPPASQLPHHLKLNGDGKFSDKEIVHKYRAIWELGTKYWDVWYPAAQAFVDAAQEATDEERLKLTIDFDYDDPEFAACELLAVNYIVSPIEVSMLGLLLDTDTAATILWTACNCMRALAYMMEDKKKGMSSGSPIAVGVAD